MFLRRELFSINYANVYVTLYHRGRDVNYNNPGKLVGGKVRGDGYDSLEALSSLSLSRSLLHHLSPLFYSLSLYRLSRLSPVFLVFRERLASQCLVLLVRMQKKKKVHLEVRQCAPALPEVGS